MMDSTNNGTTTLRKAYDLLKSESASLAFSLQEFENLLDCSSCSNKEYLMLNEFMLVLRAMEVQLTSTLFTSNCATASDRVKGGNNDESPAAKKAKHDSWSREDRQAVVRRLSRVRELQIAVSQDLRLERYSQVPRLARICEIYKLSQGEARLLSTMAVLATMETQVARCAVSEEDATRRSYQICRFAGVSEVDFEAFIDSGREHCKDNIIQVTDDEYQQNALPAVRINKICTKLIRGDDNFTEEELIKLAWTKLESVLAAEGIKTGISSKGLATPESKKHAPENNMEEENDTCDERVGAIGPSPTSVLSQDKEFETASLISTPYAAEVGELQYLGELFEVIALQIRLATARTKAQVKAATEGTNQSRILFVGQEDGNGNARAQARELEAKVKVAEQKLANRTNATPIKPRLITMAHKLGLDEYEVRVVALLVGRVLSPVIKNLMDSWEAGTGSGMQRLDDSTTVGACLAIFSPNFADQVAKRSKFYKSSRLLSKGILRINAPRWHAQGSNDLTESRVELDRRVLDHLVGLDSEISEIFESSELITPKAKFCHVVLPDNVKEQLITMVEAYSTLSEHKDKLMLDEAIPYGRGLVVLLAGPSGTGKTLTVHALAEKMAKRVLQVDFASLRGKTNDGADVDADLRGLFREAEMANAIVFFDECESIFKSRDLGGDRLLRALLQEIEKTNSLVFLATNRPAELDSAMHRRVSLVCEYKKPGYHERKAIWQNLSTKLPIAPNSVDWDALALKFELTGGFIKNALLAAVLYAIQRDGKNNLLITDSDLRKGCALQQRGVMYKHGTSLGCRESISKETHTIHTLALSENIKSELERVILFEKKRGQVFGTWSFGESTKQGDVASCIILYGPRGAGKRTICSSLARELGSSLYTARTSDVICAPFTATGDDHVINAGSDAKRKRLDAILDDARLSDSVLMFDDFDCVFGAPTSEISSLPSELAALLKKLGTYPGVVTLVAHVDDTTTLRFTPDLLRLISAAIPVSMPSSNQRAEIFRLVLSRSAAPLDSTVDFLRLGQSYELLPTSIRRAATNAAVSAAVRGTDAKISQKDLIAAAKHEYQRLSRHTSRRT